MKLSKSKVEKVWLQKIKSEYPHMTKMQRLAWLFVILRGENLVNNIHK